MSLRDQLLKAGVVNKKQARKAEHQSKKVAYEQQKNVRLGVETQADEIASAIEQRQLEAKAADIARNQQIQKEREEKARYYQITDLIFHQDQLERNAPNAYFFTEEDGHIRRLQVSDLQALHLANGTLGIVSGEMVGRDYVIMGREQCLRVKEFDSSLIRCLHPEE